ncbi:sensor domain-containing diguanylate cyclase [Sphingomonas hylomeconis]|uniref:diguanylate cyclase n=1 Tax=Sphingomonas hylomeconis TaxID=1395958 RepID=A0ABV7STU2_9SPHN|nr:diguanylate cyclase [Sphingomonas hylomeconis]
MVQDIPFARELQELRLLNEYCGDVIARVGNDMVFSYISPSVERLFGWSVAEAVGHRISDFVLPDDLPVIAAATARLIAGEINSATVTVRIKTRDGRFVWAEITSRPIGDHELGRPGDRAIVIRDVTDRKRLEDQLKAMAMKDGLTGLANRRAFDIALDNAWDAVKQAEDRMSLLLIDVDHFKDFNDYYGHQAGDDCLRAIAAALMDLPLDTDDVVARYGGEELVIILAHAGVERAAQTAAEARAAVEALRLPHRRLPRDDGSLTVSIGAATVLWRKGGTALMPDALIASADRALYQAKRCGRNQVSTGLVLAACA